MPPLFATCSKKCLLLQAGTKYFVFVIMEGELNPRKTQVLSLPKPSLITHIRQFTGLASYFKKFVPWFSEVMKPLYKLSDTSENGYDAML